MPEDRGWLGDSWAFTKALGGGVWDAGAGIVEGVGGLVKGGYALATDEKVRESAWNTTKEIAQATGEYAGEVWDDPAKAYRDARDGATTAYNNFEKAREQAEAEGRSAEFWGELTGKGIVEVGGTLVSIGVVSKAGKLGKMASVADDVPDTVSASQRAKNVEDDPVIAVKDEAPCSMEKCPVKKEKGSITTEAVIIDDWIKNNKKVELEVGSTREQQIKHMMEKTGIEEQQAEVLLNGAYKHNSSVAIGGSRVRGNARPDSDLDIGYDKLSNNQVNKLNKKVAKSGSVIIERTKIFTGNETSNISKIKSPEEFFQRTGMRSDPGRTNEPFLPSGSYTYDPNGSVIHIPPRPVNY